MVQFSLWVICKASNLEQVANLLHSQVNSASYPQLDSKLVSYGLQLRGEGLVWLIGAVVCLLAANHGSNCLLTREVDGRIVHCGITLSHANQLSLPRL